MLQKSDSSPIATSFTDESLSSSSWLRWPGKEHLSTFLAFCRKIARPDPVLHTCNGEMLNIVVSNDEELDLAERALQGLRATFHMRAPALQ